MDHNLKANSQKRKRDSNEVPNKKRKIADEGIRVTNISDKNTRVEEHKKFSIDPNVRYLNYEGAGIIRSPDFFTGAKAPLLTHLNISRNELSAKQCEELGVLIANCRQLELFNARSMGKSDLKGLLPQLKFLKRLKILDLSGYEFDEDAMQLFADSICECRNLEHLGLSESLRVVGFKKLVATVSKCHSLKYLDLSKNKTNLWLDEQLYDIEFLLTHNSLEDLDLSYNGFTNNDINYLAKAFSESQHRALGLNGNSFNNDGLDQLFDAIEYNNYIKTLNVDRIPFTAEGLEITLKKLQKNTSLCTLRILLPRGVESLYEVIEDCMDLNLKRTHFANGHDEVSLSTKLKISELNHQIDSENLQLRKKGERLEQLTSWKWQYELQQKNWEKHMKEPISSWNHNTVEEFMKEIMLGDFAQYFKEHEDFNGQMLLRMNSLYLHKAGLTFEQSKRLQASLFLIHNFQKLTNPPHVFEWTNDEVLNWLKEKNLGDLKEYFKISPQYLIMGKELLLDNYDLIDTLLLDPKQAAMVEVAIQSLQQSLIKRKVPDHFKCPITYEVMKDPVIASDGHTYERKAIEEWLQNHDRSPLTNEKLQDKKVYPCLYLKTSIAEFLNANNN